MFSDKYTQDAYILNMFTLSSTLKTSFSTGVKAQLFSSVRHRSAYASVSCLSSIATKTTANCNSIQKKFVRQTALVCHNYKQVAQYSASSIPASASIIKDTSESKSPSDKVLHKSLSSVPAFQDLKFPEGVKFTPKSWKLNPDS